jgi:alpha-L-fucosidase
VGPDPTGLIPAPSVDRLREMGAWMRVNGEAIYGTTASPFKGLPWGLCTRKDTAEGTTLYMHILRRPAGNRIEVPRVRNDVETAYLLADTNRHSMTVEREGDGLAVLVTNAPSLPLSSVVVVKLRGALDLEPEFVVQAEDGSIQLRPHDAAYRGRRILHQPGPGGGNVGVWQDPNDWVEWQINVTNPGKFRLKGDFSARNPARLVFAAGDQTLRLSVPATGDYRTYRSADVGTIEIAQPGVVILAVRAVREDWRPVNLKNLQLSPVE